LTEFKTAKKKANPMLTKERCWKRSSLHASGLMDDGTYPMAIQRFRSGVADDVDEGGPIFA
jgi:hypothetical protein